MICKNIKQLVNYGIKNNLLEKEDETELTKQANAQRKNTTPKSGICFVNKGRDAFERSENPAPLKKLIY